MSMIRRALAIVPVVALLAACSSSPESPGQPAHTPDPQTSTQGTLSTDRSGKPFSVEEVATFDQPWAMAFLPDGKALVTELGGALKLVDPANGDAVTVAGTPQVATGGQGGFGDIALAPSFGTDRAVYLTWVEAGDGGKGAVLAKATLTEGDSPNLDGLQVIWRQEPKVSGDGHFSQRIAISPDGKYLFLSSGDRQKMDPAQDLSVAQGKIMRLNLDGTPAAGNPFADRGGVSAQIWSYGHRNPLGLAFDAEGNLWSSEMGPKGGDEINLIVEGKNYGWPKASNGSHYDGSEIPDHTAGDGFEAPKAWWTPSISPGSLMIYSGDLFAPWKGDAFVGALSGKSLIRVHLNGTTAAVAERWDMGERIREVEQGPDGAIWLLEDGGNAKLLKLTPLG
ncbi:MAG: PQQ-dependent sugar dehydrogenase [Dermatophilus congolensis]|nr:PQQ-dependent sugar dehydrogenase [Dermatophilus congolensis]